MIFKAVKSDVKSFNKPFFWRIVKFFFKIVSCTIDCQHYFLPYRK